MGREPLTEASNTIRSVAAAPGRTGAAYLAQPLRPGMDTTVAHPAVVVTSTSPREVKVPGRRTNRKRSGFGDALFFNTTRFFAVLTLLTLVGIIASLVIASWPSISRFGLSFLW